MSKEWALAAFEALPGHSAVLDAEGNIIAVNEAWRTFALKNGLPDPRWGVSVNYLQLCERASGECALEAQRVAAGIREVLTGRRGSFELVYGCEAQQEKRWFRCQVTRFTGRVGALVVHLDVTEQVRAELEVDEHRRASRPDGEAPASTAEKAPLATLIVEDNPAELRVLEQELSKRHWPRRTAPNLGDGLKALEDETFDVILVKLGAGEGQDWETLTALRWKAADSVILVVSGVDDEELGAEALRHGADEFVVREQLTGRRINRLIRYSMERRRRRRQADSDQRWHTNSEAHARLGDASGNASAQGEGGGTLREQHGQVYEELCDRYQRLLERAVEEQAYRLPSSTLNDDLRRLGQELGRFRAGPRDVIELHIAALNTALREAAPSKAKHFLEEGRIRVLELMGFLAGFYRIRYPGDRLSPPGIGLGAGRRAGQEKGMEGGFR